MRPGLEIKAMPGGGIARGGRVEGYASRFGVPDRAGDVVKRGAFARSLERMARDGRAVRFLWQHDPARPVGVWERIEEDATGLFVSGRLVAGTAGGDEAARLLAAGALDGLSIGYRVVKARPNRTTGGRTLVEIDLWEVSLVTFPMLPSARAALSVPDADLVAGALAEALAEGPHPR